MFVWHRDLNQITSYFQLHKEAMDLCQTYYGDYHPLIGRINHNLGICHEQQGDYYKAYDCFSTNYKNSVEVFGSGHVKSQKTLRIIQEPMFRRIASERGDTVPE